MTLTNDFTELSRETYAHGMTRVARELEAILHENVRTDVAVEVVESPDRPCFLKIVTPSPEVSKECFAFFKDLKIKGKTLPGMSLASCIACDGENLVVRSALQILDEYVAALKTKVETLRATGSAPAVHVA